MLLLSKPKPRCECDGEAKIEAPVYQGTLLRAYFYFAWLTWEDSNSHIPHSRMPFEMSGEFLLFGEIQGSRLLQLKAEHSEYAPVSGFLKVGFSDAVQHATSALPLEADIFSRTPHVR
jgi:hypothetical protein